MLKTFQRISVALRVRSELLDLVPASFSVHRAPQTSRLVLPSRLALAVRSTWNALFLGVYVSGGVSARYQLWREAFADQSQEILLLHVVSGLPPSLPPLIHSTHHCCTLSYCVINVCTNVCLLSEV